MPVYSVDKLMTEARRLAAEYRRATGRPLAISGEIAKHDAIRLLGLESAPEQAAYDAIGRGQREGVRYLIKGRAILDTRKSGQRIGQLKLGEGWDRVLLVLLDANFAPFQIFEAERARVEEAFHEGQGSKRSRRGALSVARFKALSELVWSLGNSAEERAGGASRRGTGAPAGSGTQ